MSYPATVSDFYLDKYEITVGRFRAFVNAGMGTQANPPAAGMGAHPLIAGSGWNSTWNTNLPANTPALKTAMKCEPKYQTWTDTPGANESQPQNCMTPFDAFAFCAWDGGRLPTEAEWNYAAAGGSEQRAYPWSIPPAAMPIDDSYAVYCGAVCDNARSSQHVGTRSPKGDGKWGHADLAGNVSEWALDRYASQYLTPCSDCVNLVATSSWVIRGAAFNDPASHLLSAYRVSQGSTARANWYGARCARSAQ
jgi:formylglycine-generating enzyme required for sulfatase activity